MWRWEVIAAHLKAPKFGVELGVAGGRFTEHLLATFPTLHMVAVDQWQAQAPQDRAGFETYEAWDFKRLEREFAERTQPYRERLTVLRCDTAEAAALVQRDFDFVFIDAEHTYEGVRDDIAAWAPKIVAGGLLSGHDYCAKFPGVKQAVDEFAQGREIVRGKNDVWMIRL